MLLHWTYVLCIRVWCMGYDAIKENFFLSFPISTSYISPVLYDGVQIKIIDCRKNPQLAKQYRTEGTTISKKRTNIARCVFHFVYFIYYYR